MARFRAWAEFQGRNLAAGEIIEIPPVEAAKVARAGTISIDRTSIGDLARAASVSPRLMRYTIEELVREGTGPVAAAARARHGRPNRELLHDWATPPDGMADLLADALGAALGPNAVVFRERPRDWRAIEAAAREILT